jgi:hypothetical protein
MLYKPPNRRSRNLRGSRRGTAREHLEEDALQAYLRRRFLDLFPRYADRVDVEVIREAQQSRRQRFDLVVVAPCHGSTALAKVVVELKWSTNKDVQTGLVEQLGNRYLLGEGLEHGIFLVGWSGKWRPGRGHAGANTKTALSKFLVRERDEYCQDGCRGQRLHIAPFVLDLEWCARGSRTSRKGNEQVAKKGKRSPRKGRRKRHPEV